MSGGGEEIALLEWNEAAGVWVILDFFQFGLSYQDASLGRYPDGADYWVWFATPTADATNNYAIILGQEELQVDLERQFAPNPTTDCVRWTGAPISGRLVDGSGRELLRFPSARGLCLTERPAGMYILQFEDGTHTRVIKHD